MTPAVKFLDARGLPYSLHQYDHDTRAESYGNEAVEKLGFDENSVFKTLVVELAKNSFAVCVVPVAAQLNLKKAAAALGVKKLAMADAKDVRRATGYILGGVSPVGLARRLTVIVDQSAAALPRIYVSAGKRGLELEMTPIDLCAAAPAEFAQIAG